MNLVQTRTQARRERYELVDACTCLSVVRTLCVARAHVCTTLINCHSTDTESAYEEYQHNKDCHQLLEPDLEGTHHGQDGLEGCDAGENFDHPN